MRHRTYEAGDLIIITATRFPSSVIEYGSCLLLLTDISTSRSTVGCDVMDSRGVRHIILDFTYDVIDVVATLCEAYD